MPSNKVDFEHLINNLEVGICRCSIKGRAKFLFANEKLCAMFGLQQKGLSERYLESIFLQKKEYYSFIQKMRNHLTLKDYEVKLKGKGDKTYWCAIAAGSGKDELGKGQYIDILVEDITFKKAFEKQLIESKDIFQTVFNKTAAAITVTDKKEKIIAWNPFTERMLDMQKRRLV